MSKTPFRHPESFCYANLGEKWGLSLKACGYDAVAVKGKADKLTYLYLHDGKAEFKDASHLKGKTVFETIDALKAELGDGVSVLANSPAGENQVTFATVGAEGGAVGSGGMGAVMGAKNLKAIVVAGGSQPRPANPEKLRELADIMRKNRPPSLPSMWGVPSFTHPQACAGCGIGCSREVYTLLKGGRKYRALCQSSVFYMDWIMRYGTTKDPAARLHASRACDTYGLDSTVTQSVLEVIEASFKEGLITEKQLGIPMGTIGTTDFIEFLAKKIANKEGYGEIMAQGTAAVAEAIGPKAVKMLPKYISTRSNDKKDYDPRMLITTALCYATEPRRPIMQLHEIVMPVMMWNGMPGDTPGKMFPIEKFRRFAERAWGSEAAADFSTYEGKALAAKKVQDHAFVKESMVTCDLGWISTRMNHVLEPEKTFAEYDIYNAVTGKQVTEDEMDRTGERIANLQRAIFLRDGWQGRKDDSLLDYFFTEPMYERELFFNPRAQVPGKDGALLSKVGVTLDRQKFEDMKTEYYRFRGWDENGIPTKARLEELGLGEAGRGNKYQ